jgi:hypothetical protein
MSPFKLYKSLYIDIYIHFSRSEVGAKSALRLDIRYVFTCVCLSQLLGGGKSFALILLCRFESPRVGDKLAGIVYVHVREGHNIVTTRRRAVTLPYVKLYLSKASLLWFYVAPSFNLYIICVLVSVCT